MTVNPVAFKGIYKITMPKATEAKNEQEKGAYTDTITNVVVMGANNSIVPPKVDKNTSSIYFKIDDKNDTQFETGFKNIIEDCNKRFNIDMAQKAYMEKVSEEEFQNAESLS